MSELLRNCFHLNAQPGPAGGDRRVDAVDPKETESHALRCDSPVAADLVDAHVDAPPAERGGDGGGVAALRPRRKVRLLQPSGQGPRT